MHMEQLCLVSTVVPLLEIHFKVPIAGYNIITSLDSIALAAVSRLDNDPAASMRDELIISPAVDPIVSSTNWTDFQSMSSRPNAFYFSGYIMNHAQTFELHVQGDVIRRTWFAEDLCNVTSCVQIIVEK